MEKKQLFFVICLTIMWTILAGCSSMGVQPSAPTLTMYPTVTPIPPGATIEMLVLPTSTPGPAEPDASSVAPPVPSLEVLDFRNYFPPVPPGLGKVANHLMFFSDRSGTYQLYQVSLDGSELSPLTNAAALDFYDMEPDWSPDGKIAFTNKINNKWEIFVLYPDERVPTQLTNWSADAWSLAWSPDGKSLAFVSDKTLNNEIYVIPADGGEPVNLTQRTDASDFSPVWSPDGQHILFVSDREEGPNRDIYVMKSDGSEVTRLTTSEARDTSPDWSPDGSKIAFVSDREGNFEVYVMDYPGGVETAGGEPVRLTTTPAYEWSPTWSPDGKWIAFTSLRDHEKNYEIYIMAPDGSGQTRLTSDPADDIIPRWWP